MHIKNEVSKTLVLDGNAQQLAKIAGAIKEIIEEHADKVTLLYGYFVKSNFYRRIFTNDQSGSRPKTRVFVAL